MCSKPMLIMSKRPSINLPKNGVRLSGGQSRRVAIARTFYHRKKIHHSIYLKILSYALVLYMQNLVTIL